MARERAKRQTVNGKIANGQGQKGKKGKEKRAREKGQGKRARRKGKGKKARAKGQW